MATKDCRKNNEEQTVRQIKIVVEKYADGYVAYPLGLKGVVNGFHTIAHRIFATLVKQQAQLVVRSEAAESDWPRQYRADSINLSLHLSQARSGEYLLLGIITDPNESIEAFTGMTAELYPAADGKDANRAKKPLLSEQVDDLGNIVFSAVPVGNYVMIIHLGERELVIEGLEIQPG